MTVSNTISQAELDVMRLVENLRIDEPSNLYRGYIIEREGNMLYISKDDFQLAQDLNFLVGLELPESDGYVKAAVNGPMADAIGAFDGHFLSDQQEYYTENDMTSAIKHSIPGLGSSLRTNAATMINCHKDPVRMERFLRRRVELLNDFDRANRGLPPEDMKLVEWWVDIMKKDVERFDVSISPIFEMGDNAKRTMDPYVGVKLEELATNAMKYQDKAKRGKKGEKGKRAISTSIISDINSTAFTVLDNGIGVPLESAIGIFEEKSRGGNVGEISGTGIGLSQLKELVEQSGGEIVMEIHTQEMYPYVSIIINEGTNFVPTMTAFRQEAILLDEHTAEHMEEYRTGIRVTLPNDTFFKD